MNPCTRELWDRFKGAQASPYPFSFTPEEAEQLLDVHDGRVHCLASPVPGVVVGADWDLEAVREHIRKHGAELAGPESCQAHHGIHSGRRFFATRREAPPGGES